MKSYLLQTLKELALLGAIKNKIEISSLELAKQLETAFLIPGIIPHC